MSIQHEIERLQNAKAKIIAALTEKGVTVPTGAMMDELAGLIENIDTGIEGYELAYGTYTIPSRTTSQQVIETGLSGEPSAFFLWSDAFAKSTTTSSTSDYCFAYKIGTNKGYCCWNFDDAWCMYGSVNYSNSTVTCAHGLGVYSSEGYWVNSNYYWIALMSKE